MVRAFSAKRWTIWSAAIATIAFAAAGCEEKVYQIEQWPRGDKLWRRLILSRRQQGDGGQKKDLNDKDKAEVSRIAGLYGGAPPKLTVDKATFIGAFANALPQDVGGDGHYVRWESPLGRVCLYVERFRGSDGPVATLEARRKTVDQLVDLVVGWFDSQLREEPDWPALRKFLDATFRHDVQNLSLYGWLAHIAPESDSKKASLEIPFRVTQYLVERHYAAYEEAPALLREVADLNQRKSGGAIMARIRRLVVARAGAAADGRLAHALSFLKDEQTAWASWERYLRSTVYYKQERSEFQRRKQAEELRKAAETKPAVAHANVPNPKQSAPKIDNTEFEQVLYFKFLDSFTTFGFGNSSRAQVSLETPREPFWTNGKWVPDKLRVEWSQRIAESAETLDVQNADWPTLCFAAWDEPKEQMQKQLLGSVCITRDDLFQYNLWYQGLSSREKAEWDPFVATLPQKEHAADRLEGFLFSDEPVGRNGSERVASDGANALLSVLRPHKGGVEIRINGAPLGGKRPEPKKDVDPRD
jgi:hypothetical protein